MMGCYIRFTTHVKFFLCAVDIKYKYTLGVAYENELSGGLTTIK